MPLPARITIATRESALALWQANHIRDRLIALYPALEVHILGMTTQGDRMLSASLAKLGGKGLFVKELETALEDARADIAVHSMKDVPVHLPSGFTIAAVTEREDPRDAFVSNQYPRCPPCRRAAGWAPQFAAGASCARATRSSPLRHCAGMSRRVCASWTRVSMQASFWPQRGCSVWLAARITSMLEPEDSLPAAGQGALGIECREARTDLLEMLQPLNHAESAWCVRAERSVSRALSASCVVPIGAFAQRQDSGMYLRGFVARPDGTRYVSAEERARYPGANPEQVGQALAEKLTAAGAREILAALIHEQ